MRHVCINYMSVCTSLYTNVSGLGAGLLLSLLRKLPHIPKEEWPLRSHTRCPYSWVDGSAILCIKPDSHPTGCISEVRVCPTGHCVVYENRFARPALPGHVPQHLRPKCVCGKSARRECDADSPSCRPGARPGSVPRDHDRLAV